MNEEENVYIVIYMDDHTSCPRGHFSFYETKEEALRLLCRTQVQRDGHLMLIQGAVIGETTGPEHEDG